MQGGRVHSSDVMRSPAFLFPLRFLMENPTGLMLPVFKDTGKLPAGVYRCSFEQFSKRFGNNRYRRRFLRHFQVFLQDLKNRGGVEVFVGGSFVTCKALPSDIDFSLDITRPGQDLKGLKASMPLHFVPEQAVTEEGESFLFSDFFQGDDPAQEKVGIVVIDLQISF